MISINKRTVITNDNGLELIQCQGCKTTFTNMVQPFNFYILEFGKKIIYQDTDSIKYSDYTPVILCEKCYDQLKIILGSEYYNEGLERGDW